MSDATTLTKGDKLILDDCYSRIFRITAAINQRHEYTDWKRIETDLHNIAAHFNQLVLRAEQSEKDVGK